MLCLFGFAFGQVLNIGHQLADVTDAVKTTTTTIPAVDHQTDKLPSVITFVLPSTPSDQSDFAPGATSTNKETPITYRSGYMAVATITPDGLIHIVGPGTTQIIARQAGNEHYTDAEEVVQTLVVKTAIITHPPVISYQPPPIYTTGKTITSLIPTYSGDPIPISGTEQITTYAGLGLSGNIDGPLSVATFTQPNDLATDKSGNVYVCDAAAKAIRKVSADGMVSTFAGNYTDAWVDGKGSGASFHNPVSMCLDADDNMYVVDWTKIRKITPDGTVTTIAGNGPNDGPGSNASFTQLSSIAIDQQHNLYVSDRSDIIYKITQSGVITIFAGAAEAGSTDGPGNLARFQWPCGLRFDNYGNLFVADFLNNLIRKIDPSGIVTTVAGRAGIMGDDDGPAHLATFRQPMFVLFDKANNLFISDFSNSKVRKMSSDGIVSTLIVSDFATIVTGPGRVSGFQFPTGLTFDRYNNLLVADPGNHQVAALKAYGYTIDKALPAGLVFNSGTGIISGTPTAAAPAADYTVSVTNASGTSSTVINIEVSDLSPSVINFIIPVPNLDTDNSFDPGATSNNYETPITYSSSNTAVATIINNGVVHIVAPGTTIITAQQSGSQHFFPAANVRQTLTINTLAHLPPVINYITPQQYIAGASIGNLIPVNTGGLIPTYGYRELAKYAGMGTIGHVDGSLTTAKFQDPFGMACDNAGNLYVAESNGKVVRKITPDGMVSTFAGIYDITGPSHDGKGAAAGFINLTSLCVDGNNNVFVIDGIRLRKITPDGTVTTLTGGPGQFSGAGNMIGLAADNANNVYFGNDNAINKFTPDGNVTTVAGSSVSGYVDGPATSARFSDITALTFDKTGNLYITDSGNGLIRKMDVSGNVTTVAGSPFTSGSVDGIGTKATFAYPYFSASDQAGNILVSELPTTKLRKITPAGAVTTITQRSLDPTALGQSLPMGVAVDRNNEIYLGDPRYGIILTMKSFGYAIDKILPAGLIFDLKTGTISGTPTVASPATDYTVTAYNAYGISSTIINIEVIEPQPSVITFVLPAPLPDANGNFSPGAISTNKETPITYTSSNPAVATITAEGLIHIVGAGTSMITANQIGNSRYIAASPVLQTLFINDETGQDITFHLSDTFLPGKKVIKVKRDFKDPYLWVLTSANEVFRIHSVTKVTEDYTAKFSAYNNLKFTDIAGRSQDTVFVATDASTVLEYKKGTIKVIGSAEGITGRINSIGIATDWIFNGYNGSNHAVLIGTTQGFCFYNDMDETLRKSTTLDSHVYEATYRNEMINNGLPGRNYPDTVSKVGVLEIMDYTTYSGEIWMNGNSFGQSLKTAFFTRGSYNSSTLFTTYCNLLWATENGLFQNNWNFSYTTDRPHRHYLKGLNLTKVTSIYGLTSFGYSNTGAITQENLLVGSTQGLLFSNSKYQKLDDFYTGNYLFYHYNGLGNKPINDICVNATSYTAPICEDGIWVAADDGLYLLKPDYVPYVNTGQQIQAAQFEGQSNTVTKFALCADNVVKATINNGYYSGNQIQWVKDGKDIPNESNKTLTIKGAGDYYAILYDPCSALHFETNHLKVTVIQAPVFAFNYPDQMRYCDGSVATLKTDNNAAYKYRWYKDGVQNGNLTPTLDTKEPGIYKLEISACEGDWVASKPVQLKFIQMPQPDLKADKLSYCEGDVATLTATVPIDGSQIINWPTDYQYKWYRDGVLLPQLTGASAKVNNAGKYTVTVTGCTGVPISSVELPVNFISKVNPVITASKPVFCIGDQATLSVKPIDLKIYTIQWKHDGAVMNAEQDKLSINTTLPGDYTVSVGSRQTTCTEQSAPFKLSFEQPPTLSIVQIVNTTLCDGESVVLRASYNGGAIRWSTGETTDQISVRAAGNYTATVTSTAGCITTENINVAFFPNPVTTVPDAKLCPFNKEKITLTAPAGFAMYEWNGKTGGQSYITDKVGMVTLTVTDQHKCKATQTITISAFCNEIKLPNTFTPNGDGVNDTWIIGGLDNDPSATIRVYNRQGVLIFQSTGYSVPWNGTYNSKKLPAGVYYYVINARQGTQVLSGSVTVIY